MSTNSRWFLDTKHSFSFKAEHEISCCYLIINNRFTLFYIVSDFLSMS